MNSFKVRALALFTLAMAPGIALAQSKGEGASGEAKAAREHIEKTAKDVLKERGREMEVTSRDRSNSEAHQRGAIDIRSKDQTAEARQADAKAISERLGKEHTVIVEEVHVPGPKAEGPTGQVNTSYRGGEHVRTSVGPVKADATHTHIQPDRQKEPREKGSVKSNGAGRPSKSDFVRESRRGP